MPRRVLVDRRHGPLEVLMHKIGMFDRKGLYTTEGLAAITNFRYVANGLWTTEEAVGKIEAVK